MTRARVQHRALEAALELLGRPGPACACALQAGWRPTRGLQPRAQPQRHPRQRARRHLGNDGNHKRRRGAGHQRRHVVVLHDGGRMHDPTFGKQRDRAPQFQQPDQPLDGTGIVHVHDGVRDPPQQQPHPSRAHLLRRQDCERPVRQEQPGQHAVEAGAVSDHIQQWTWCRKPAPALPPAGAAAPAAPTRRLCSASLGSPRSCWHGPATSHDNRLCSGFDAAGQSGRRLIA